MLYAKTLSMYAVLFNEGNIYWKPDDEHNRKFLESVQTQCNYRLKAKGYLFLNEVYEMLDMPRTQAGQIVGWFYDEEKPIGDNCVIIDIKMIYGCDVDYALDFNVDGNIAGLL